MSSESTNSTAHEWPIPRGDLALADDEVHVWRALLRLFPPRVEPLYVTLSADEQYRAGQIPDGRHRQRFIVTRGLLRAILSSYLGQEPGDLRFDYGPPGKPVLVAPTGQAALKFNLTHSYTVALYAVTRKREVGIDLEYFHSRNPQVKAAETMLSPQEKDALDSLPRHLRREALFRCWTRKEAFLKASGEGPSLSPQQFDFSVLPGEPARLLAIRGDARSASRWSLEDLDPGPGYIGALAVEGQGITIRYWMFDLERLRQ